MPIFKFEDPTGRFKTTVIKTFILTTTCDNLLQMLVSATPHISAPTAICIQKREHIQSSDLATTDAIQSEGFRAKLMQGAARPLCIHAWRRNVIY